MDIEADDQVDKMEPLIKDFMSYQQQSEVDIGALNVPKESINNRKDKENSSIAS